MIKKNMVSFFFLCVLSISLLSTTLAFFLSKYDYSFKEVLVKKKSMPLIIVDKPLKIKEIIKPTLDSEKLYQVNILIKDNTLKDTKIVLKILNSQGEIKNLNNLKYDPQLNGYNLTNFNGNLSFLASDNNIEVKLIYYDYFGYRFLNPQISVY